jgi:ABC-type uncharacterized transport system permease subunit
MRLGNRDESAGQLEFLDFAVANMFGYGTAVTDRLIPKGAAAFPSFRLVCGSGITIQAAIPPIPTARVMRLMASCGGIVIQVAASSERERKQ